MPEQILPKEAYISAEWFKKERRLLFSKSWSWVGLATDFTQTGDYITDNLQGRPVAVLQDSEGSLRGFHNLCRHRGTELLEGRGNAGKTLVCPYHRWTYGLDGQLRGVPNRAECFPGIDRGALGLHPIAVGVWKGMVFANPDPQADFDAWIAPLKAVAFPHDITSPDLAVGEELTYRMKCNWKVFFENAIDGYHLGYLHENTLGPVYPDVNRWDSHGEHMVWYSTETKAGSRIPKFVADQAAKYHMATIKDADQPGYGGVYMLFPTTLITPSPWSITISKLVPVNAETTLLKARTWVANSWFRYQEKARDVPGYNPDTGMIQSSHWKQHPLKTNDFQTEDIWVCEKIQRSLNSPEFTIGPLAQGDGAEAMLPVFQESVLGYLQT